ncbi:MAG TPA: zinc-binding alcohol dehydrogenase [Chloroflexia bacterium]|nr:zinc-binding alcohol dehydrogenase [Chloroflexia bacterium]
MPRELILLEPYKTAFRQLPDREPLAHEIKLRTLFSAISHGAEMRRYRGLLPHKVWDSELRLFDKEETGTKWPKTLGYENISLVTAVGEQVESVEPGSLVWLDAPHQEVSFASREEIERGLIFKPHDPAYRDINPARFTFFVRTRVALGAVHDASIVLGERVAVIGVGVIGLIGIQLARLNGATEVYGVDLLPGRLDLAERFGAVAIDARKSDGARMIKEQTGGVGVDVALEVSGTSEGLHEAIRCCRIGGRVVTVGSFSGAAQHLYLGEEWLRNRITMLSSMTVNECPSRRYPGWDLKRLEEVTWALLKSGAVDVEPLISHIVPFDEADKAYRMVDAADGEAIQVILWYDDTNTEGKS